MISFENVFYIGLAGFIGVNLNIWITRLLKRIKLKKNHRYYIPWGIIIVNAVAALALGILMNRFEENSFLFQYICVGLIGSIGSSYMLFSNNIFSKYIDADQRIVSIVRIFGEIIIDILLLMLGMQIIIQ